jgi:hypothetical protein
VGVRVLSGKEKVILVTLPVNFFPYSMKEGQTCIFLYSSSE